MRYLLLAFLLLVFTTPATAQTNAPCGVVDSLEYPIDNLVEGYDDFALHRARFNGNHVGIDIGFNRWGDPVRAAAKGRVTYSDIEGWDTEKGVVIVEHTFPDGSIIYTLYGHMEQTDTILFPQVGACVDHDTILGGIGWPSRGRPHLHYEIRNFNPDDGGPGYVTVNPLDLGWYHPLDFTQLWRIKFESGFMNSTTFKSVPTLPAVLLDSGMYALAAANVIEASTPDGLPAWRVEADGVIVGITALPGDRIVAYTHNGQVLVLEHGRYTGLWAVDGLDEPFLNLNETLVFVMPGGGLEAYDPAGDQLWTLPATMSSDRVNHFQTNGDEIALGIQEADGDVLWRLIDSAGQVNFETEFSQRPVIAPAPDGSWVGLDGSQFKRFSDGENHSFGSIGILPGRTAAATVDLLGNSYFFMGDEANSFVSLDPGGEVRWMVEYPVPGGPLTPLLATGSGCLLYSLDANGMLNVFNTGDGSLVNQMELYAGGDRSSSPRARLLEVDRNERIHTSSGFLSIVTLNGWALGGEAMDGCRLG